MDHSPAATATTSAAGGRSSIRSSTNTIARSYSYHSPGGVLSHSDDPLIFEIGTRYLRAGFAGDSVPKCQIPYTEDMWKRVGDKDVESGKQGGRMVPPRPGASSQDMDKIKKKPRKNKGELWQYDLRNVDTGVVEALVERALREAYNKYLLVDSKGKKVILPISPLLPTYLMKAIANTLFVHFQPPTITFFSSPVLCTVAAGLRHAIVVDIGWNETTITPVFDLRAIPGFVGVTGRTRRAGKLLKKKTGEILENLLVEKGIGGQKINEDFLDEIVVRVVWCENYDMRQIQKQSRNEPPQIHETDLDDIDLEPAPKTLHSTAGSSTMLIPLPIVDSHKPLSINVPLYTLSQPPEYAFFTRSSQSNDVDIADAQEPDDEDVSIPQLLYNTLVQCPIDVRAACLSRIVIVGGPSNIPGLKKRLVDELGVIIQKNGGFINVKRYPKSLMKKKSPIPKTDKPLPSLPSDPPEEQRNVRGTEEFESTEEAEELGSGAENKPEAASHFSHRQSLKSLIENETKPKSRPGLPPGVLRGVKSLGAWVGASILAGARVKGQLEIDKERFLASVAAGGMGIPHNML